ncbi:MAG TPA: SurA N-terminal domain-containing protein, partial [candidate division Zixibacteria bacterium]|nr:SurA N-terminal domain-containing protein [candidate division Zixibacteria bacterium]
MFDTLRKMIVPIIVVVLLFFVAMIVLEWGLGFTGSQTMQEQNLAAVINGEEVPWPAYNRIYESLVQSESQNSPDGDVSDAVRMQLHERAWQQLVH